MSVYGFGVHDRPCHRRLAAEVPRIGLDRWAWSRKGPPGRDSYRVAADAATGVSISQDTLVGLPTWRRPPGVRQVGSPARPLGSGPAESRAVGVRIATGASVREWTVDAGSSLARGSLSAATVFRRGTKSGHSYGL